MDLLMELWRVVWGLCFLGEVFVWLFFVLVFCVNCYKMMFCLNIWVVFLGEVILVLFLWIGNFVMVLKIILRSGIRSFLNICELILGIYVIGKILFKEFFNFCYLYKLGYLWCVFCYVWCGCFMYFLLL